MSPFPNLPFKFHQKQNQNGSGINPSLQTQPGIVPSASGTQQPQPKTLAELEKEIEAQFVPTRPHKQSLPTKAKGGLLGKIKWAAILIGVPIGLSWAVVQVANQPDPTIRRYVAQNAPILLLPSYKSMASDYRQAIASAGFGMSRSKMFEFISGGDVRVNWKDVTQPSHIVKSGDLIAIRGKGRLEIGEVAVTKKERYRIQLTRYM